MRNCHNRHRDNRCGIAALTIQGRELRPVVTQFPVVDTVRLEQSEDFFQNAPVGFVLTGLDGTARTYNRAFSRLAGWPWPESPASAVFRPVSPDSGDPVDVSGLLAQDQVVFDLPVAMRPHSAQRPLLANASALRDDAGHLCAVRWILRPDLRHAIPSIENDPTDYLLPGPDLVFDNDAARWADELGADDDVRPAVRAMDDTQAAQRQDELDDFIKHAPAAIHFVGLRGTVLRSNDIDLAVAGYSDAPQEFIGSEVRHAYADQSLLEDILGRWDEGRPSMNLRARLVSRDGTVAPVVIFSTSRIADGAFQNTRDVVFPDADPNSSPTRTRHFSWPSN